jgi:spore protease
VIAPGVLGKTGMETVEIIKGVVEQVKPAAVIVIDALASRRLSRLGCTVQISDSGISPGSGVGNTRKEISQKTLGVPVVAIGVPTVVDAATMAADAICRFSGKQEEAEETRRAWSSNEMNFFVTPKETDQIIRVMGSFIGYGINLALNCNLSFEDMLSLIG